MYLKDKRNKDEKTDPSDSEFGSNNRDLNPETRGFVNRKVDVFGISSLRILHQDPTRRLRNGPLNNLYVKKYGVKSR